MLWHVLGLVSVLETVLSGSRGFCWGVSSLPLKKCLGSMLLRTLASSGVLCLALSGALGFLSGFKVVRVGCLTSKHLFGTVEGMCGGKSLPTLPSQVLACMASWRSARSRRIPTDFVGTSHAKHWASKSAWERRITAASLSLFFGAMPACGTGGSRLQRPYHSSYSSRLRFESLCGLGMFGVFTSTNRPSIGAKPKWLGRSSGCTRITQQLLQYTLLKLHPLYWFRVAYNFRTAQPLVIAAQTSVFPCKCSCDLQHEYFGHASPNYTLIGSTS